MARDAGIMPQQWLVMTLVSLWADGNTPTLLYAYGGFEVGAPFAFSLPAQLPPPPPPHFSLPGPHSLPHSLTHSFTPSLLVVS